MKYLISAAFAATILTISSCKDEDTYNHYIEQMQDSVLNRYNSTTGLSIQVLENTNFTIVVGNKNLYNANDAARQKEANDLGAMALRIFKGYDLEKGKLIVTADVTTKSFSPPDGKTTMINMDSLRKSMGN